MKNVKCKMKNTRGVSLPIVIGLVAMLMIASIAINELIIRSLRSARNIEASDRAYFAAEAGIEDALYDLSAHSAGYETGKAIILNDINPIWKSDWDISSSKRSNYNKTTCSEGNLCGRIGRAEKIVISFYKDNNGEINTISGANLQGMNITFKIPQSIIDEAPTEAFFHGLQIDNDGDLGNSNAVGQEIPNISGLNEDAKEQTGICNILGESGQGVTSEDSDCDGREDEDSLQDPVIYWKIVDDKGSSLTPLRGCSTDNPVGGEICEMDFPDNPPTFTLSSTAKGIDQNEDITTIGEFLTTYDEEYAKLQLELLVVAPLEQSFGDSNSSKKISIPYIEFEFNSTDASDIPNPIFTISSTGVYQDFQQTIVTNITPKTTSALIDFTIIQQQ